MSTDKSEKRPMPLMVDQVANGYIVSPGTTPDGKLNLLSANVFPSKAALFAHLAEHFTHWAVSVPMDDAPPRVFGSLPAETISNQAIRDEMQKRAAEITGAAGFTDFRQRPTQS